MAMGMLSPKIELKIFTICVASAFLSNKPVTSVLGHNLRSPGLGSKIGLSSASCQVTAKDPSCSIISATVSAALPSMRKRISSQSLFDMVAPSFDLGMVSHYGGHVA